MMLMMGSMLIVPFLLIGAVAYALGWRPQSRQTPGAQTRPTPLEILKMRYSRGELTREQYDEIRRDLEGRAGTTVVCPKSRSRWMVQVTSTCFSSQGVLP